MTPAVFAIDKKENWSSKAFYFPEKEIVTVKILGAGRSKGSIVSSNGLLAIDLDSDYRIRGVEILEFAVVPQNFPSKDAQVDFATLRLEGGDEDASLPDPISCRLSLNPLSCEILLLEEESVRQVCIGDSLLFSVTEEGNLARILVENFSKPSEYRKLCLPPQSGNPQD